MNNPDDCAGTSAVFVEFKYGFGEAYTKHGVPVFVIQRAWHEYPSGHKGCLYLCRTSEHQEVWYAEVELSESMGGDG